MKVNEATIVEAATPLRFANFDRLISHAIKHALIQWQSERWRTIIPIPSETCAAARQDWMLGHLDTENIRQVVLGYQQLCSESVVALCEKSEGHVHLLRCQQPDNLTELKHADIGDRHVLEQIIYAWEIHRRLFLIASMFVRKDKPVPYLLRTGYRPSDRLDLGRFRAKARAWVQCATEFRMFRMLVDHGK